MFLFQLLVITLGFVYFIFVFRPIKILAKITKPLSPAPAGQLPLRKGSCFYDKIDKMEKLCKVLTVTTPNRILLSGLWFGGEKPQRALVFIHGLSSNVFAHLELLTSLASEETAVIYFNNRGSGKVNGVKKIDKRKKKGYSRIMAGEAHEVFTDCVDDLQGVVNLVKSKGVKEVYLVGHSTGSQKSVYFLSQKGKQKLVKGVILLSPMSDYAGALKTDGPEALAKAEKVAREDVEEGREHELLPKEVWPFLHDAQRFLSLYTPDSKEEIFSYCQPKRTPTALRKIKVPMLVVLAGEDEFRDRPIKKIADWFSKNSKARDSKIVVINKAPHNFKDHEKEVVKLVGNWMEKR